MYILISFLSIASEFGMVNPDAQAEQHILQQPLEEARLTLEFFARRRGFEMSVIKLNTKSDTVKVQIVQSEGLGKRTIEFMLKDAQTELGEQSNKIESFLAMLHHITQVSDKSHADEFFWNLPRGEF